MRINKPTESCNVCGSLQTKLIKVSEGIDGFFGEYHKMTANTEINVCTNIGHCWKAVNLDKIRTWIKK